MKVFVTGFGTTEDIYPVLALSYFFTKNGPQVIFCAEAHY